MRKTLRRIFGRHSKSTTDALSPGTKCPNPNRASAPPAFGRFYSEDEPTTYDIPGHLSYEDQCQAVMHRVQAQLDTSPFEVARIHQFKAAERRLQTRFPQTRVVDAGEFPGNIKLLDGVRKEDTRFFVSMDPEDSTQYVAANLVIFSAEMKSQRSMPASMVVAEDALAHLLRQWQRDGVSDGFLAIVSIGIDTSVHIFRARGGMVGLSV
ncbi:hypothetical protein diail_3345 [Diaporthe ilicicola]|nr:hypothetical protein diail_3345 [Diaporthe ilicicola]